MVLVLDLALDGRERRHLREEEGRNQKRQKKRREVLGSEAQSFGGPRSLLMTDSQDTLSGEGKFRWQDPDIGTNAMGIVGRKRSIWAPREEGRLPRCRSGAGLLWLRPGIFDIVPPHTPLEIQERDQKLPVSFVRL